MYRWRFLRASNPHAGRGAANRWSAKLDANNFVGLELRKDARSSTGYTLTIARSDVTTALLCSGIVEVVDG